MSAFASPSPAASPVVQTERRASERRVKSAPPVLQQTPAAFALDCHREFVAAKGSNRALAKLAHKLDINADLLASKGVPEEEKHFVERFLAGEYTMNNGVCKCGSNHDLAMEALIKKHYQTYKDEKAQRNRAAVTNLAKNCGIRPTFLKSIDIPATEASFVDLFFENMDEIVVGPVVGLEMD